MHTSILGKKPDTKYYPTLLAHIEKSFFNSAKNVLAYFVRLLRQVYIGEVST
jgi:hypothetical protein